MKAINTIYRGNKFRSRLEARWAVFFYSAGIAYEYEKQGFSCGRRLSDKWPGNLVNYLPDFWLPQLCVYFEVKGTTPNLADAVDLFDCVAEISSGGGSGCMESNQAANVVIASDIPTPGELRNKSPGIYHMHKGTLFREDWLYGLIDQSGCIGEVEIGNDSDGLYRNYAEVMFDSFSCSLDQKNAEKKLSYALEKARFARFEHGESP